jgi:hypothetical protein
VSIAYDTSELSIATLQWLGRSPSPWWINSEIEDLKDAGPKGHAPLWTFLRYDAPLEQRWLKEKLDLEFNLKQMSLLERMDDETQIPALYAIGSAAAEKQISPTHFSEAFRPGQAPPSPDSQPSPA